MRAQDRRCLVHNTQQIDSKASTGARVLQRQEVPPQTSGLSLSSGQCRAHVADRCPHTGRCGGWLRTWFCRPRLELFQTFSSDFPTRANWGHVTGFCPLSIAVFNREHLPSSSLLFKIYCGINTCVQQTESESTEAWRVKTENPFSLSHPHHSSLSRGTGDTLLVTWVPHTGAVMPSA